jgi:predicted nucleotidyltransferase component of viral defense system
MSRDEQTVIVNAIQKAIVRLVATSPVGHNLILIGGFRFRFLDESVRVSRDIDYHWEGELAKKQQELVTLFRKRLLPALRRQFGFSGSANPATGPDADSPAVQTVNVAVWKEGVPYSRIEIPVEVTQVCHADKMEVRTVDGVVYPTFSDADQIESKIIAVFRRTTMAHRDLVDVFLFGNRLVPDSMKRLAKKFKGAGVPPAVIRERLDDLDRHTAYHARTIQTVIDTQLDPDAAKNINDAGGGAMVLRAVVTTIRGNVGAA